MSKKIIGIHEKPSILESIPLSFQHLTAMFGATILVPILLGVDPAIALLMNGIGTLIYTWVTKGGIPAYLGSSFAFIAPASLIISSYGGFGHAQSGFIFFGLFFVAISFVVKKWGIKWIDVVMPPAVMGAVVAIIGLELAPVAAQQAGLAPWPTDIGSVVSPFCHGQYCDTGFDVYFGYRDYRNCIVQRLYASDSNSLCRGCRLFSGALHGISGYCQNQ